MAIPTAPEPTSLRPPRRLDLLVRSAPARPEIIAGLRAAVATMVPLLAAQLLHLGGASWLSLGGFSVALADRGGAYRPRARAMGAVAIGDALAVVLGGLVGGHPWLSVVVAFCWVGAASLARAFGLVAGGIGSSIAVAFVISLASPSVTVGEALSRGAYLLAGGTWAMVLGLFLWPIRPYRPLRRATAACYRALATYADTVTRQLSIRESDDRRIADQQRRAIRDAIEEARALVSVSRRGAQGEARRGEELLVLVQGADVLFGYLIALVELVDADATTAQQPAALSLVTNALPRFAEAARHIASTIETERGAPSVLEHITQLRESACAAAARPEVASAGWVATHAARLIGKLDSYLAVLGATADALESGRMPQMPAALAVLTVVDDRPPPLETLRASLSLDSIALRHALRVAIVTAVAVALSRFLGLHRGYWVTLTAIIILQPYAGATLIRALQRVAGTVAGGVLTAGLVAVVHDSRALLAIIFLLATACVAYLRVNYLLFSIFLTPTFVLLAEMSAGDWHLAQLRVVNTLVGGALGLAGAWLLWPSPERNRFPELAGAALRAASDYVRLVGTMWTHTGDEASVTLAAGRRELSLAIANGEASFERLVAESTGTSGALEAGMTLLAFLRRLSAAVTALASVRHAPEGPSLRAAVVRFTAQVADELEELASAVADPRPPRPSAIDPPALDAQGDLARAQFERVGRQVEVVRAAVARL